MADRGLDQEAEKLVYGEGPVGDLEDAGRQPPALVAPELLLGVAQVVQALVVDEPDAAEPEFSADVPPAFTVLAMSRVVGFVEPMSKRRGKDDMADPSGKRSDSLLFRLIIGGQPA